MYKKLTSVRGAAALLAVASLLGVLFLMAFQTGLKVGAAVPEPVVNGEKDALYTELGTKLRTGLFRGNNWNEIANDTGASMDFSYYYTDEYIYFYCEVIDPNGAFRPDTAPTGVGNCNLVFQYMPDPSRCRWENDSTAPTGGYNWGQGVLANMGVSGYDGSNYFQFGAGPFTDAGGNATAQDLQNNYLNWGNNENNFYSFRRGDSFGFECRAKLVPGVENVILACSVVSKDCTESTSGDGTALGISWKRRHNDSNGFLMLNLPTNDLSVYRSGVTQGIEGANYWVTKEADPDGSTYQGNISAYFENAVYPSVKLEKSEAGLTLSAPSGKLWNVWSLQAAELSEGTVYANALMAIF